MQRQAILTVRLVLMDEETAQDAERLVADAMEHDDLMAQVKCERIEEVEDE